MKEPSELTIAQLRKLEEADRRPIAVQPPEGFDTWAEFYEWERSSSRPDTTSS